MVHSKEKLERTGNEASSQTILNKKCI